MELPVNFTSCTRALLGDAEYDRLAAALLHVPPASIRLNEMKLNKYNLLSPTPLSAKKIPWCTQGYYLENRLTYTFDPLFHAGCYYVQEASSMFLEQVLRQYAPQPVMMLDLCAAPGGKSVHARSLLPEGSLLVANETIGTRARILAENLAKQGHPDVPVTNNDPAAFASLGPIFDIILADVPCSGEGMFRKDPEALKQWSPAHVELCAARQQRIIADVWPCLKPSGILIYSTCTYNIKENEENIAYFQQQFGAEPLPITTAPEWNITTLGSLPAYRFMPHNTEGEGFFMAALRKPSATSACPPAAAYSKKPGKDTASAPPKEAVTACKAMLIQPDQYDFRMNNSCITAHSKIFPAEQALCQRMLRVIQAGIAMVEIKGKDLIPQPSIALSLMLQPDAFAVHELEYPQAIAYLRKENITIPAASPRGHVLVTHKNIPLGFVKNIGNRTNNLYPPDWRIRSGYLPQEIRTLFNLF